MQNYNFKMLTNENMKKILKYMLIFIFLLSALLKTIDFSNTTFLFNKILNLTYEYTKVSLMVLITIELFISAILFKGWYYHNVIYFFCLIVFNLFVIINLSFIIRGVEDCGCMGTFFISDPLFSLIKSIIILVIFVFISSNQKQDQNA